MKKSKQRLACVSIAAVASLSGAARAETPAHPVAADAAWPHAPAVRDLLRLDLQAALAAAAAASAASARGVATLTGDAVAQGGLAQPLASAAQDGPQLLAIYGVGDRLRAELSVDGRRQLLGAGVVATSWPADYRLIELRGRCMKARRAQEAPLTLCLRPAAQEP